MANSFQLYTQGGLIPIIPSAIISDGIVPIPIYGVSHMMLNENYQFPLIGSTGAKAILQTHDDSVTIKGSLVGDLRFTWKVALELLAESSKRGNTYINGLILITAMTVRTDMQIRTLTFDAFNTKRASLDLTLVMDYMPKPKNTIGKLVDAAGSILVGALGDVAGN